MAPRPSSQKEPSSRRVISKSPKPNESNDRASSAGSSSPARSRQARHSPFAVNRSLQIEQTTRDAMGVAIVRLGSASREHAQQFPKLFVYFRVGVDRSTHFGAQCFTVLRPQSSNMASES